MMEEIIKEGDVSDLYDRISDQEIISALNLPADYIENYKHKIPINDEINRYYFYCERAFIKFISMLTVKLPVFKVVIPCGSTGANYYIVHGEHPSEGEVIAFFRGTYGYGGTGPHQSAFIEKFFKKFGYTIRTTYGDNLLSLLRIL